MTGPLAGADSALAGAAALPRDNGELVFEEPWQGRALGMAVVLLERLGLTWADFQPHLVAAIDRHRPTEGESAAAAYYAAFVVALEELLRAKGALEADGQG